MRLVSGFLLAPGLLNPLEAQRALQTEYMRVARPMANSSIPSPSGTAYFWLWIDATGKVADRQLERSSGHAVLDQAAGRVLEVLRLRAAFRQGCTVSSWVLWPITFRVLRIGGRAGGVTELGFSGQSWSMTAPKGSLESDPEADPTGPPRTG